MTTATTPPSTTTLSKEPIYCQPPPTKKTLAHRNDTISGSNPIRSQSTNLDLYSYGVPMRRKILTVELYNKRFHEIRNYLAGNLGLTLAEREGILRLLRLYAYYGRVYPKASQIADDFGNMVKGCSKRSFWRAIAKLRDGGMIQVRHRFLHGRQISNCYRLDKLILCLVRWLLEHSTHYLKLGTLAKEHFNALHVSNFWRLIWSANVDLCKALTIQPPGGG